MQENERKHPDPQVYPQVNAENNPLGEDTQNEAADHEVRMEREMDGGSAYSRSARHQKTKRRRPSKTAVFGFIVLIFAVIGLVATIRFVTQTTYDIIDNKGQKTAFQQFIYPMVMLDPPPFDDVQKLEPTTVLTAAIWNLVLNEDTEKYPKDEFNFMQVPQTDVEAYAAKLFGTGLKLTHQSVGDAEFTFEYDADLKTYTVPSTIVMPQQMPRVQKIERDGNIYRLTVDYIPTGSLWAMDEDGKKYEPNPTKTMLYLLKKNGDSYQLTGVQDTRDTGSEGGTDAPAGSIPSTAGGASNASSSSPAVTSGADTRSKTSMPQTSSSPAASSPASTPVGSPGNATA